MRVLDDHSEAASPDGVDVDGTDQVGHIPLGRTRRRCDRSDLVVRGPAELLSLEVLLDLLDELRRRLDPRRLEELDLHHLGVLRARAHVNAGAHPLVLEEVPVDRRGHDVEIGDVDSRGDHAGERCPLDEAARRRRGPARHDALSALEGGAERDADAQRRLGSEVDVDQTGDRVPPKEAGRHPRLPDQVPVDHGAGLDLLEGIDADAGQDNALLPDRARVSDGDAFVQAGVRTNVAGLADNRAFDERAPPDIRGAVDYRPDRPRVVAQRDARRKDGIRPDRSSWADPAVVADKGRTLDRLEVRELDALPDPDVAAETNPLDVQAHLLVESVEVRLPVLIQVTDVLPVAFGDVAVNRPPHLQEEREELLGEVEGPVIRDVTQHLGVEDVDPRVDRVGEDLAPRRLLEEALDPAVGIRDHDPELERVVDVLQADRDHGFLLLVEAHELAQVDVAERVTGDDEKGLLERALGELDRAGRARGRFLHGVADGDPVRLPRSEIAADGLRHEGECHDDVFETVGAQQLHDVLHAGLAHDRNHRLGLVRGQRAQPRSLAAGHDYRFHRVVLQARKA